MEENSHILVVDDEHYITSLIKRTLELAGYKVTVANDGKTALDIIAKNEQDLVLLDIKMPELDGYMVLERIRKISNVPVLMLTAVHEKTAIAHALGLGADDYIEKPFDAKILTARVKAKLRRVRGELDHIED